METDMGNVGYRIIHCWGSRSRLHLAEYLWVLAMFSISAFLENNRIGLYLIPPFGATLTILLAVPDASVAQPYALVAGCVIGATVGTLLSFFSHGTLMAIVAAVAAFGIINLIHAYHPPGVALAMFPLLLHPGRWFPVAVVLPFTIIATGSATLLSRLVVGWPSYPKRLDSRDSTQLRCNGKSCSGQMTR
jgi:CBS-domain-containing membrane protein